MNSNIRGIISEQELKKLLKMEIHFSTECYSCPINILAAKKRMSCIRIIQCISGKTPSTCSKAISLLRDFINEIKSKQNKI